jgi:hypothetical protein
VIWAAVQKSVSISISTEPKELELILRKDKILQSGPGRKGGKQQDLPND